MHNIIVSDAGPIITLEKMEDGFLFIQRIYDKILVPPQVMLEISSKYTSPHQYLSTYNIINLIEVDSSFKDFDFPGINELDDGEIEAIFLEKD